MNDQVKKDLSLSENFKKANSELEQTKQYFLKIYKEEESDTIEASILLHNNSEIYKQKLKKYQYFKRANILLKELKQTFPNLNEKLVLKNINKLGLITTKQFVIFLFLLFVVLNAIIYSLFALLVTTTVIYAVLFLQFCVLVLIEQME